MTLAGRLGAIVEDVPKMAAAAAAMAFGAHHEERTVGFRANGIALRLPEAWPARAAVVFVLGGIKRKITALAQEHAQMDATGPIFALDVGTRARAFAVLDALQLIDISNNIGDARSLMCHPASSTHANMGDEARAAMGVTEGLLRINVGLEDIADLTEDMDQALAAAGI